MKLKSSLTKTCWQDIREEVHGIDSYLAGIIDEINPSNDLPLYIAEHPYGQIFDDGVFYYPDDNGDLRARSDERLSKEVRDDFSYADEAPPAGLVLDKTIELFTESINGTTPFGIYQPGDWFALSIHTSSTTNYFPTRFSSMSAGVRSIYMLPKIGDNFFHKRLGEYIQNDSDAPSQLNEHWNTFREICSNGSPRNEWKCRFLLLTNSWIEHVQNDPKWYSLRLHLLEHGWSRFSFDITRRYYDMAFSEIQIQNNLRKIDPYLVDTAKHLFRIMAGGSPGFSIADDDLSAPVAFLQKVYTEKYGLGKYYPHLFVPAYFKVDKPTSAVYYSFQVPTTFEFSSKAKANLNTLGGMRDVKRVVSVFKNELLKLQTDLKNFVLADLLRRVEIDFFHLKPDQEKKILLSQNIDKFDPNLANTDNKKHAHSGPFVMGCALLHVSDESFDN